MARELLHEKLAAKLMRAIREGRYPVGSLLPKELEIAEAEGVSRSTVRAAMKALERRSLIRRKPHVGTIVVGKARTESFDEKIGSMADLDRLAAVHPRKIFDVREIVVSRELAPRIRFPAGETLIRFSMVRAGLKEGDPPIAWTQEYVRRDWQRLVTEAPKHPDRLMITILCSLFKKHCTEINQTIEAALLSEEAAGYLRAKAGEPCLRIFRRYIGERGEPLLTTVSVHPASRYAFNLDVREKDAALLNF